MADAWTSFMQPLGSVISSAGAFWSAERQMKFQERMSNTAHQREVEDLKKAGLNPILSAGGSGASQPQGAMVEPGNPFATFARDWTERKKAEEERNMMKIEQFSKLALTTAQTARLEMENQLTKKQIEMIDSEKAYRLTQGQLNSALQAKAVREAEYKAIETRLYERKHELEEKRYEQEKLSSEEHRELMKVERELKELERPGKANIARAELSRLGKISPYLRLFSKDTEGLKDMYNSAKSLMGVPDPRQFLGIIK